MRFNWVLMPLIALLTVCEAHRTGNDGPLKRAVTQAKIPAMEYLGCGYDILYGNPLADYGSLVDPGYRNPIISFSLVKQKRKLQKDLKAAKIPGAWIRPLVSCKRSSEKTIVKSMEEYQRALSVDASVGVGAIGDAVKFSLSSGYAESSDMHLSNNRILNIQKNYCFLLEAALPVNGKYTFKKGFKLAAVKLKPEFKKATKKCNTIRFSTNPNHEDCQDTVKPWMDLFELFGTHFTYNIKIGGRMTEISQETRKDDKKSSKKEANIAANAKTKLPVEANASIGGSKSSNKASKVKVSFTYLNILGGRPTGSPNDEDAYLRWIQSISDNPMPIRAQLAPISKLFKSPALKEAYDDALSFYMELKGVKGIQPANTDEGNTTEKQKVD